MIIALLVYGTIVGALAAGAARALEAVSRAAHVATRWTWVGAMALTLGLVGWSAASRPVPPVARANGGDPIQLPFKVDAVTSPVGFFTSALASARRLVGDVVERSSSSVVHALPSETGAVALSLWVMASVGLLGVLGMVERRGKRRTDAMPEERLHGARVRISESTGPAVVGLAPPRIIVPGWLLARSAEEQRAALAHEQSHVRAGDPWLLLGACAAVAFMPWNVALWYMLSRIRLAVEVDCDARVLRSGIAARSYGELLISVAEHASTHKVGALALSGGPSHLHQRIQVMTAPVRRFSRTRIAAACAVAAIAVLAACEAQLPTQADVSNMDATTATAAARKLALVDSGRTKYFIDDVVATEAAAKALASDSIASIQIVHDSAKTGSDVRITTQAAQQALHKRLAVTYANATATAKPGAPILLKGDPTRFQGLVYIDGVKTDAKTLATLTAMQIASIQVLKGGAAQLESSDPAAAYGIIKVTTKK